MSLADTVSNHVHSNAGGWQDAGLKKALGGGRGHLSGGMVGAVDYETGDDREIVAACEAWITKQTAKKDGPACHDLKTFFCDGVQLGLMLEAITDRKIKTKKVAVITAQKLDNLKICMEFIQKLPVKAGTLSTEDFLNGNLTQIVPFILKLIRRFDPATLGKPEKKLEPVTFAKPLSSLWKKAQSVRPGSEVFEKLKEELDENVEAIRREYDHDAKVTGLFATVDALVGEEEAVDEAAVAAALDEAEAAAEEQDQQTGEEPTDLDIAKAEEAFHLGASQFLVVTAIDDYGNPGPDACDVVLDVNKDGISVLRKPSMDQMASYSFVGEILSWMSSKRSFGLSIKNQGDVWFQTTQAKEILAAIQVCVAAILKERELAADVKRMEKAKSSKIHAANVTGTNDAGGYTAYQISVTDGDGTYNVSTRYSEIEAFVASMKKQKKVELPKLPGKKMFGSNSPKVIEERKVAIDFILTCAVENYGENSLVKDLLARDKQSF